MEGVASIYNMLIMMVILFVELWISLWKTGRIKCGIKGADCPAR